jgi:hypothetical protein
MTRRKLTLVLCVFLAFETAHSGETDFFATELGPDAMFTAKFWAIGTEGAFVTIDTDSITSFDGMRNAWVVTFNGDTTISAILAEHVAIRCEAQDFAIRQKMTYDRRTAEVLTVSQPPLRPSELRFGAAPPGSIGSQLVSFICNFNEDHWQPAALKDGFIPTKGIAVAEVRESALKFFAYRRNHPEEARPGRPDNDLERR